MTTNTATFPKTERLMPKSNLALILRSLVPIATNAASEHLQAFLSRLSDALRQHTEQKQRPTEAVLSADVLRFLKKNSLQFYATAPGYLTHLLIEEIDTAEKKPSKKNAQGATESGAASFDDAERKNLIRKLGESIELKNAELVEAFNKRVAYLLQARSTTVTRNPFRAETFVAALFDAWCDFYEVPESHGMVLRLFRAEMFEHVTQVLTALNESLIARGVLVEKENTVAHPVEPMGGPIDPDPDSDNKKSQLLTKLRKLLPDEDSSMGNLLIPNLFPEKNEVEEVNDGGGGVHGIATSLQKDFYLSLGDNVSSGAADASILHRFKEKMQPGMLTQNQEIAVDLLIGIFEYVFAESGTDREIKALLAQLQIPLLKAALLNKDFFFKETHPARQLLESLLKASMLWNKEFSTQDPLYLAIKNSVDQIRYEDEPLSHLFAAIVAEFDAFVSEETRWSEIALTEPIADALRQEKIRLSHDVATREVDARIDTGEVAGFVEKFLEKYWVPVLALAHSVKEDKPDAFDSALKSMDDLIWSMKPKANPDDRKDLIARLPSLLSLFNVWLNTVKCDEKDKAQFFAKLAERHAAIVRADQSLRGQIEFAVNVAEKVSERRLKNNTNQLRALRGDKFTALVNGLALGDCVEFLDDDDDTPKKFKLAWISAKRSILLFSNHQGRDAFSIASDVLAQNLRIERANVLVWVPVVERALLKLMAELESKTDKAATLFVS